MQLPRYHRLRHSFYRLQGTCCPACERTYFPPRGVCPSCRQRDLQARALAGTGTLYSYTRMSQAPRGFGSLGPATVGMVQLDDGPLIMSQLTDVEGVEIGIGMRVEMVTRKISESGDHGYIVYGYKFRPVVESADSDDCAAPAGAAVSA